jgi:hypothetical protein
MLAGFYRITCLIGSCTRWARARGGLVHAKHHLNHHKDEAVTTRTIAIIARFFDGVTAIGLLYNLYYVYLDGRLMARPRLLTFCNDAGKTRDPNLAWSHSEAYGSAWENRNLGSIDTYRSCTKGLQKTAYLHLGGCNVKYTKAMKC